MDGLNIRINAYINIQFLLNLTFQSLFRRLSRFYLTSRELPFILKLALTSLSGKNTIPSNYHSGNNIYMFHIMYTYISSTIPFNPESNYILQSTTSTVLRVWSMRLTFTCTAILSFSPST